MFIIWRGWGILVVLIPGVFVVVGLLLLGFIFGDEQSKAYMSQAIPILLLLSAIFTYKLGQKLNSNNEKILIDPETDEEVVLRSPHDLFWIPMQYWAILIGILSIIMFAALVNRS